MEENKWDSSGAGQGTKQPNQYVSVVLVFLWVFWTGLDGATLLVVISLKLITSQTRKRVPTRNRAHVEGGQISSDLFCISSTYRHKTREYLVRI